MAWPQSGQMGPAQDGQVIVPGKEARASAVRPARHWSQSRCSGGSEMNVPPQCWQLHGEVTSFMTSSLF
jgi:hypothetical protein